MREITVSKEERHSLARSVALGAPVAVLLWLGILRLVLGSWSLVFPGIVALISVVVLTGLLCPDPVGKLTYRFWNGLIFGIDWLVTRLICVVLYYLLITPLGCVLRLIGLPYAHVGRQQVANPRWVRVVKAEQRREDYLKQY